jgi:tol-pal system protein YbgF
MYSEKAKDVFFSSRLVFSILYSVIFLTSCVTSDEVGRVQWELNEVKKKTDSIEARLPSGEGQGIEESQKATARAVSDLFIRTQELSKEVQRITGQLEEGQYHSEKRLEEAETVKELLSSDIEELKTAVEDLKDRLVKLEGSSTVKKEKKEDTTGEVKQKEKETESSEIKDVYMAAYESYKAGSLSEAREKFESFIRDYPENEYTDNARFWIAESYYRENSFEDAILAYEDLFRKNPDSDKIPGAMLKQGLAFFSLKDNDTGRLILEKLLEKYPDSDQAGAAKKKLEESNPKEKK